MSGNSDYPQRRSLRLQEYDYSAAGAYFVTINAHNGQLLFGQVTDDDMCPNQLGIIAQEEWHRTSIIRPGVTADEFVVMPNHVHGILFIDDVQQQSDKHDLPQSVGAHSRAPARRLPRSLGSIIAGYKSIVTKRINMLRGTPGKKVWQRNYYERVIRNEDELDRARHYVRYNPHKWPDDPLNPRNLSARTR